MFEVITFWLTMGVMLLPFVIFTVVIVEAFLSIYVDYLTDGRIDDLYRPLTNYILKLIGKKKYKGAYSGVKYYLDSILIPSGLAGVLIFLFFACYMGEMHGNDMTFLQSVIGFTELMNYFLAWPVLITTVMIGLNGVLKKAIASFFSIKDKIDALDKEGA